MAENIPQPSGQRREDRRRGGGPPQLTVRDTLYGRPQPLPDGRFQVGVTVTVQVGNNPPREEVRYNFLVAGRPHYRAPEEPVLDVVGRAGATLTVPAADPRIALALRWRHGSRTVWLPEVELPLPERERKPAKVAVLGKARKGDVFSVTVARLDQQGRGLKGKINYVDADPSSEASGAQWVAVETDEYGVVVEDFTCAEEERQVVFFLPERPDQGVPVDVPVRGAGRAERKLTATQQTTVQVQAETTLQTVRNALRELRRRIPTVLEVVGRTLTGEMFTLTVLRRDEQGGLPGEVFFHDAEHGSGLQRASASADGVAEIPLVLGERTREVMLFLPERPTERVSQVVPPKPNPPEPLPPPPKSPFELGREAARKWLVGRTERSDAR